jgi:hypothetical protein
VTREELVYEIYEKPLAPEEFERRVREALEREDDLADLREQIRWFKRRYPTAAARLRYSHESYASFMGPLRVDLR